MGAREESIKVSRRWETPFTRGCVINGGHPGYLYTAFTSPADYELVLNYARQLEVVLWENAAKRCFFGTLDGHANIKNFIERRTGGNA
jgi:hypothetical protein